MKIVELSWVDACSLGNAWDSRKEGEIGEPFKCQTVGYLVRKTRKKIIVAQSQCLENNDIMNRMVIPRGCVTEIKELST